jgi:hypothetical protein
LTAQPFSIQAISGLVGFVRLGEGMTYRELSVAETMGLEPPSLPFRLLHIERADEFDRVDKLAFNVFVELSGLISLGSPCLYFLAPRDDHRCGFALADHSPRSHYNALLMLFVDQERAYEGLNSFEERVRARARRLVADLLPAIRPSSGYEDYVPDFESVAPDADDMAFDVNDLGEPADLPEPPSWTYEQNLSEEALQPVDDGQGS